MNQGRVWCVVHPTVGLPLLLGSVAVTSLIVHASIMTHTTWMSTYWMGKYARTGAPPAASLSGPSFSMKVVPDTGAAGSPASFVVTVTPAPAPATRAAALTSTAPVRTASAN